MKKVLFIAILILACFSNVSAQKRAPKKDPVGKWIFNAPAAPENYQLGIFQVSFNEMKYAATLVFSGSEYLLPADNIVVAKDSLFFSINLENESVVFAFSIKDKKTMTGQATYSGGVVPVTLNKEMKKE
jgi:hypothetical protein